jgi:hypothetical protein
VEGRDIPFPVALVMAEPTKQPEAEAIARSVTSADYGVIAYPTTILIDPEGRVVDIADELIDTEQGRAKLAVMFNAASAQQ